MFFSLCIFKTFYFEKNSVPKEILAIQLFSFLFDPKFSSAITVRFLKIVTKFQQEEDFGSWLNIWWSQCEKLFRAGVALVYMILVRLVLMTSWFFCPRNPFTHEIHRLDEVKQKCSCSFSFEIPLFYVASDQHYLLNEKRAKKLWLNNKAEWLSTNVHTLFDQNVVEDLNLVWSFLKLAMQLVVLFSKT